MNCEICGRERTTWVPEQTMGAFVVPWAEAAKCWNGNGGASDREHWRIGYEREKARADAAEAALAKHEGCIARSAKAFDESLGQCLDRADKAEAALAAARREIAMLQRRLEENGHVGDVPYDGSCCDACDRAALAAPAAGDSK